LDEYSGDTTLVHADDLEKKRSRWKKVGNQQSPKRDPRKRKRAGIQENRQRNYTAVEEKLITERSDFGGTSEQKKLSLEGLG